MAKLVSNVYSEALFETALEKDQVDSLYEEALSLREIFTENAELLQLLDHPKIVREEKLEILKHIFFGKLSGGPFGAGHHEPAVQGGGISHCESIKG